MRSIRFVSSSSSVLSSSSVASSASSVSSSGSIASRPNVTSASADDEEDDYMSDRFLQDIAAADAQRSASSSKAVKSSSNTVTPHTLPLAQRMEQTREQGLQQAISTDNIGHKLLAKMGYVSGTTLGRNTHTNTETATTITTTTTTTPNNGGLSVPLPVIVKTSKTGVGHDAQLQRIAASRAEDQRRNDASAQRSFQDVQRERARHRTNVTSLRNCVQTCLSLEGETSDNPLLRQMGVLSYTERAGDVAPAPAPAPAHYPHQHHRLQPHQQRSTNHQRVSKRPRSVFEDDDDSDAGDSSGDDLSRTSKSARLSLSDRANTSAPSTADVFESILSSSQQTERYLSALADYLRGTHRYCIWCGVQYESDEELERSCPGSREVHDLE